MKTLFIALKALIFIISFVLFWGWIAISVRTFDRSLKISLPAWTEMLGIISAVIGGVLVLICGWLFVARGRGTPAVFDAPKAFVAVGPYKYVRNPMYIGGLMLLIGFGLYQRSVSILLLSLGWFLLVHLFVIFYEEPTLKKKFGAAYGAYDSTVPRWIPSVRRAPKIG